MSITKKIILITGASSGMGKYTALALAEQGHTVYAGARRLEKLLELESSGIIPVEMDVTSGADNARVVDQILSEQGRIDVLINNAGFGLYGSVEDIPLEDAKYQFEVNLFGLADITKKVIPHMRKQKSGRIVSTSSMGGKIYTPLGAWYHATKHALEGWSDCLRLELQPFGIDVILIEPGGVRTEFGDVLGEKLQKYYEGSAYKEQMDPFITMMDNPKMKEMGTAPEVLAKEFVKAVNSKYPKTRYVKGMMARPLMFLRRWFGDRVYDFVIRKMFRLM